MILSNSVLLVRYHKHHNATFHLSRNGRLFFDTVLYHVIFQENWQANKKLSGINNERKMAFGGF